MSSVEDHVRRFASVGRAVGDSERVTLAKVAEVAKEFLQREATKLVKRANGRPVLMSYSSDGTPLRSKKHIVHAAGSSGSKVRRVGGAAQEFLVQQAFLRYIDVDGVPHTVAVLRDPLPLSHGKGAWAIYSAGVEFSQTLRQQGHQGIALQHYAFDRALYGPLQT